MTDLRRDIGQRGEDEAVRFLEAHGFRVVERNWRPGKEEGSSKRSGTADGSQRGEVDCIAWQGRVLCFVEVKTRTSLDRGAPQEAVTKAKQRQLSRLANTYVSIGKLDDVPCRFDVVEVWLVPGEAPRLAHHANAFDYIAAGSSRGARFAARSSRIF